MNKRIIGWNQPFSLTRLQKYAPKVNTIYLHYINYENAYCIFTYQW